MRQKVWTSGRKWQGNLIPGLFVLPFLIYCGSQVLKHKSIETPALLSLVGAAVVGLVTVNFFGLTGNKKMRAALEERLHKEYGNRYDQAEKWFVGVSRPAYVGALDPHEDIGFLVLQPGVVEFLGDSQHLTVNTSEVRVVRFRPNVHSWIGLGRWISLEGNSNGKPFRLFIEPREKNTLLANKLLGKSLRAKLQLHINTKN